MIARLIFLILLSHTALSQDGLKLKRTKVSDHISMLIADEFYPTTDSDLAQRAPSVRQPIAAYTTQSRVVDLSVKISATQWREKDVALAKDFFKASLFNLYNKVDLIQDEIRSINGQNFIVFEADATIFGDPGTPGKEQPIRNYIYAQYYIRDGKTLVFTFVCPARLKPEWQLSVEKMMNSVKIKGDI